jgi:hypothetical protein
VGKEITNLHSIYADTRENLRIQRKKLCEPTYAYMNIHYTAKEITASFQKKDDFFGLEDTGFGGLKGDTLRPPPSNCFARLKTCSCNHRVGEAPNSL